MKLVLALITLSLIACGDITDSDCSIDKENYSHTVLQCGLDIEGAEQFCDPNGEHERDMCIPYYDMSKDTGCHTVDKCWVNY